jgi:hypothetical protein
MYCVKGLCKESCENKRSLGNDSLYCKRFRSGVATLVAGALDCRMHIYHSRAYPQGCGDGCCIA